VSPADAPAPGRWRAAELGARPGWRLVASAEVLEDAAALERWAGGRADPVSALQATSVSTPALDALAGTLGTELDDGSGVALVTGLGSLPETTLRLVYLKLGLGLGRTIDTYGRLYDVHDTGQSYRDKPIPVSQTRESTGMHTDSSGRDVWPRIIGLACVRQAPRGGESRLVSALQVHDDLQRSVPHLLDRLRGEFVRDVVTPGSERDPEVVRRNRFPVFAPGGRVALRYMRYWIERGHARVGEPLDDEAVAAFDALDAALEDPRNVLRFRMEPGDLLFIDNTTVAHDRDGFVDDPHEPRLMLRLWLSRPVAGPTEV